MDVVSSSLITKETFETNNGSFRHKNDETANVCHESLLTPAPNLDSVTYHVPTNHDIMFPQTHHDIDPSQLIPLEHVQKTQTGLKKIPPCHATTDINAIDHSIALFQGSMSSNHYHTISNDLVVPSMMSKTPDLHCNRELLDDINVNGNIDRSYYQSNSGILVTLGTDPRDAYAATPLVLRVGDAIRLPNTGGDLIDFHAHDDDNTPTHDGVLLEPLLNHDRNVPHIDTPYHDHGLFRHWNTDSVRKFYKGIFGFINRRNRHTDSNTSSQNTTINLLDEVTLDDNVVGGSSEESSRRNRPPGERYSRRVPSATTGTSTTSPISQNLCSFSKSMCSLFVLFCIGCFLFGALVRHELQCTSGSFKKKKKTMYPQAQRLQTILSCAVQLSVRTVNEIENPNTPQGSAIYWFLIGAARLLPILQPDGSDYCNSDFAQLYSLLVFRNSVHVPYPKWYTNQTLNSFADVCKWPSVTCSSDNKYITNLTVNHENLTGTIPDELWNGYGLNRLKSIELYSNSELYGTIPTSLSRLSDTLVSLKLAGTGIYGTIPSELSQLTRLEELLLDGTRLTGTVPTGICNIASLRHIQVSIPCDCCKPQQTIPS
jgi:hypothetical protein